MNRDEFLATALKNPVNVAIIDELARHGLPDAWLVAGCLVQTVWNVLTGRAIDHGIADYDVFYFDSDTSWEAEDAVLRRLHARLAHLGAKVEVRNQARVHLWFQNRFGEPYEPLGSTDEALGRFVAPTFAVGVRLEADDTITVAAPFGLEDVFAMVVRPNPNRPVAKGWARTVENARGRWPELTVVESV